MITITFEGYYLNPYNLRFYTGIYTVFAVKARNKKITEARILYIGKTKDIIDRHIKGNKYVHNNKQNFLRKLKEGEQLTYIATKVDGSQLDKVGNALIICHRLL